MIRLGGGSSDHDHHHDQSANHGTSPSALKAKGEQTSEEGVVERIGQTEDDEDAKVKEEITNGEDEVRTERGGLGGTREFVKDENGKVKEEDLDTKGEKKGEGRRRGGEENSSNSPTMRPNHPAGERGPADDVVRRFWEMIDGELVEIPPDSSDRRGAWTKEELRKMYEERE